MSEMSALSHQYEKLMESFEVLLNAVVLLKKQQLIQFNNEKQILQPISIEEAGKAQSKLLLFLKEVQQIIQGEVYKDTFIPFGISPEYKKRIIKVPTMSANISEIVNVILKDGELSNNHFITLEKLISALDFERNVVFRKLRTRKG